MTASEQSQVDRIAFEGPNTPDRGYTIRVSYLKPPNDRDALVQVFKDGAQFREFLWPAYKIYNLQAHFLGIVDGEIEGSPRGYWAAGWDGISGAIVIMPNGFSEHPPH